MRSIILKWGLFACIISFIIACNAKTEAPASAAIDKEQIKKEIQSKEDSFASLYNRAEMKNIGYYAEDATSFFQNRGPLVGKEAIINFLKDEIISNTDKISYKTNEVFVSSDGNQVVEVGAFTVVDSLGKPFSTGNYMSLFEKRDGKYVVVRDMSVSDGSMK